MKKRLFIFLFILIICVSIYTADKSGKLFTLEEILLPSGIKVSDGTIYVAQESKIYMYSLKTKKLIKTIGRKGEGPGELKLLSGFYIKPNFIVLHSGNKLVYFDKKGVYKDEKRIPFPIMRLKSFNDKFVILRMIYSQGREIEFKVGLYDNNFNLIKQLYIEKKPDPLKEIHLMGSKIQFYTKNNRLFLARGKEGFCFGVYNNEGDLLYKIKKQYRKIKIPEKYKNKLIERRKKNTRNGFWDLIKDKIVIPEYFPSFRTFFVSENSIYVDTYETKGGKTKFVVLDKKGNEKNQVYLSPSPFYDFDNNKYYYLKENKNKLWEVHYVDLF